MKDEIFNEFENTEEEMKVTINLDDGTDVLCAVVSIFDYKDRDYIVLLPLNEDGSGNAEGEYWIYRYHEDPDDPNKEPEIDYIEDDDEYEAVSDRFDEILDDSEFDELL
ncbi:MAG: DUF1292 domain-containing protein [Lachnospiraceae bacterium]|nr:DUF1292 domain-containing protein [Lachnospiraceae bacterium]